MEDEIHFSEDGTLEIKLKGKVKRKKVCHDCLNMFDPRLLYKVLRNNFSIPHYVEVCKNCKKKYDSNATN